MSNTKASNETSLNPKMLIDEGLSDTTRDGLMSLDTLINEDPALANKVITLYGTDTEVADQWMELLSEGEAGRYPFKLTAALGQSASREALRFVSYDDVTEKMIASDESMTKLIAKTRNSATENDREKAAARVAYTRLSKYAGALATAKSQKALMEPAENTEAATA
ncbi:MAG: hypothetical protein ABIR37_04625 [Candidatus Saccharimonadales bacterium]